MKALILLALLLQTGFIQAQLTARSVPAFKDKKSQSTFQQRKRDLTEGMARHIASFADPALVADVFKVGDTLKIPVGFTIDSDGSIPSQIIRVGGNEVFANHVKFIISRLPKLVPAKNYKGESVDFFYVDSPAFTVLQGGKLMPMIEPSIEKNDGIEPPIFPGCKKVAVQERLACMSSGISEILNRHVKRGSVPAGRVNILITVGPSGKIGEIKSLGSANEALSDELKRVLHYLPEMVPATDKNGGAVEYKMFVPITLLNNGPFD